MWRVDLSSVASCLIHVMNWCGELVWELVLWRVGRTPKFVGRAHMNEILDIVFLISLMIVITRDLPLT